MTPPYFRSSDFWVRLRYGPNFSRASRAEKNLLFRTQIVKKRLFLRVKTANGTFWGPAREARRKNCVFEVSWRHQNLSGSGKFKWPPSFSSRFGQKGGSLTWINTDTWNRSNCPLRRSYCVRSSRISNLTKTNEKGLTAELTPSWRPTSLFFISFALIKGHFLFTE